MNKSQDYVTNPNINITSVKKEQNMTASNLSSFNDEKSSQQPFKKINKVFTIIDIDEAIVINPMTPDENLTTLYSYHKIDSNNYHNLKLSTKEKLKNEKLNFYKNEENDEIFNNFLTQYEDYSNNYSILQTESSNLHHLLNSNSNFTNKILTTESENGLNFNDTNPFDIYLSKIKFGDEEMANDYKMRKERYHENNQLSMLINGNYSNQEEFFTMKTKSDSPATNTNKKRYKIKKFKIVGPKTNMLENGNNLSHMNKFTNFTEYTKNFTMKQSSNAQIKNNYINIVEDNSEIQESKNENFESDIQTPPKNNVYQIDKSNKINVLLRKLTINKEFKKETDKMELLKEWNHKAYVIQKYYLKYKSRKEFNKNKYLIKLFSAWDHYKENLIFVYTNQILHKEITEIIIKVYSTTYRKYFIKQIKISEIFQFCEKINKDVMVKKQNFIINLIKVLHNGILIKNLLNNTDNDNRQKSSKKDSSSNQMAYSPKRLHRGSGHVVTEICSMESNGIEPYENNYNNVFEYKYSNDNITPKREDLWDDISTKTLNTNSIIDEEEEDIEL